MKTGLRIFLIAPGKPKKRYFREAIDDYRKRVSRYASLTFIEVKDVSGKATMSTEQIQKLEAERLQKVLPEHGYVVALDADGEVFSSEQLANFLQNCMVQNRNPVVFIVGGETGLHPSLLKKSDMRLSLSNMTFPHDLVRILLLEQLYRAMSILAGHPYHK